MLVKTSNPSSGELQDKKIDGMTIYETMGHMCEKWGEDLPGVYGYSGVGAKDIAGAFDKNGLGGIVNSSRGIMCAYQKEKCDEHDYAEAARREAIRMRNEIMGIVGKIVINK